MMLLVEGHEFVCEVTEIGMINNYSRTDIWVNREIVESLPVINR